MIHYFTKAQYEAVWLKLVPRDTPAAEVATPDDRIIYWEEAMRRKWKLKYNESGYIKLAVDYWGSIEGAEKHITWFLLQL
jgi:hypothetical protein